MRLTTVILIASLMQVSAATFGQRITMNQKNAPLESVFKEIRKQSGYNFFYDGKAIPKDKKVTVLVSDASLDQTLDMALKGLDLTYEITGKSVSIKVNEKSFFENLVARFQSIDVRGRVVDSLGNGLAGASIKVKNGKGATTSNTNGDFYLQNVDENAVLLVTYIGYQTREISASANLSNVILTVSDSKLDEIQIIAYGTQQKKFSTNTIGTISAEEIAREPVSNPLLALQAKVPGLFVQQVSGANGADVNITIQGQNSMQNGNAPFYVIDGVPYSPQFTGSTLANQALGGSVSAFNFVNPADIESISILKDADATAIYGSRAANGAILITTKKGKIGATKADVNIQNGWGEIVNKLKLLNTQQYLEMRKEAYKNDGLTVPTASTAPTSSNVDLTIFDQNRYTDWQKVLVGGTAQFTDIQASISGGSATTQFRAGYGYNRQTTVYPNSLADVKGGANFNLNHNSNDKKFNYSLSVSYLQDKNQLNGQDLMAISTKVAPNAPGLYKTDGTLNWEPYPNNPNIYSFQNPLFITQQKYTGNTNNLIANNTIGYEIISGLQAKVTMGFNKLQGEETTTIPITYFKPDAFGINRSANYLTKSINSWIVEPQLTYTKTTGFGVFDGLLGGTLQENRNDVLVQSGSGYTDDSQLLNILAASTVNITTVTKTRYKYDALFARLNYRLKDKYIVNLTARRDGSSRFGDANKMHTFYAIGTAWLFGDQNIIKTALPWLSSGKLRFSYGTTGNDQIPDYTYQSLLEIYRVDKSYQGGIGIYPTSIYNPYLQWEETRKLNLGINLGFLKNRINLDVNYFRNRSSNQLLPYGLPSTTGFQIISQNFDATVQNAGLEILLNFSAIKSKNFNWQSSINFTNPKNKLIAFPNLATSTVSTQYIIGQPINVFKAYQFSGVNSTTGLYQFINSKGEKTSTPSATTDRTVLIDPNPKWYGGFSNNFDYKGFQLDFLIQMVKQMGQNNRFGNFVGAYNSSIGNQPVGVMDRWKAPGDIAQIQKFSSTAQFTSGPAANASFSDANFSGASYMRLKNASFSYTISQKYLKAIHISSARIYVQGQNLITVTKFIGSDPETRGSIYLPPLKIYTLGLQVSL